MRRNPRGPHREQWVHAQAVAAGSRCCAIPSATRSWVTRPSRRARPPPGPMPPGREVRNETGRPTGGRGASTVPSPCISRSTAWRTRATRATRWPRRCWPMACVSSPAVSITARAASSRRGGGATPSCSSKPGHTACRMRAPPRSSCTRPGGVQRECGTVAGARPPGHQPAAGALPARRLLQDLRVAAPPVAPLRPGSAAAGRQRAGCPRCRALRQALRPLRCAGVGGGPAGLAAADAAAATGARVILVDEQRELGGSLLSLPGRDRRRAGIALGRGIEGLRRPDVRILTRHGLRLPGPQPGDRRPAADRSSAGADARGFARAAVEDPGRPVILATGAHERPLVFGNNDLPGVMLASAVSAYIHRYGVLPGATRCCSPTTTELSGGHRSGRLRRPVVVVDARALGRRHPAGRRPAPWRDRDGRRRRDGRARQAAGRVRRRARVCQGQSGGRVATCHAICWRCRAA